MYVKVVHVNCFTRSPCKKLLDVRKHFLATVRVHLVKCADLDPREVRQEQKMVILAM